MKEFKITACGKEYEMQLTAVDPQCDSSFERYKKDARTLMTFIGNLPHTTVLEFKKIFK